MEKNKYNKLSSEENIINCYLKKLNFNKLGTYNFENDASYIKLLKNKKMVATTDSISENIDFFKNDSPLSIANKLVSNNLSDLSAMGVNPHSYLLNLYLPKYIDYQWLNLFTKELYRLQKKYKFYLLGGDLSRSNDLIISATFFGLSETNKIVSQNKINKNNDVWVTGNLADSYVGLQILKKQLILKDYKLKKYFLDQYYYPKPCLLGSKISKYCNSIKDISDGFIGDLKKMLNRKYGAQLYLKNIPLSLNLKKILAKKKIKIDNILNCGDNYELIIISDKKNRNKILNLAKKNRVKISRIGKIIQQIKITDDSNNLINIPREYDHFL